MATRKKTTAPEPTYNQASEELEHILREIEDGSVDVDVLTEKVERAAQLIRICRDKLSGTEVRVTKVVEELAELAKTKEPAPEAPDSPTADGNQLDDATEEERAAGIEDDGLPF